MQGCLSEGSRCRRGAPVGQSSRAARPRDGPDTAFSGGGTTRRNPYDAPRFFEAYRPMREDPVNVNELVERLALWACLPPLAGLRARQSEGRAMKDMGYPARPWAF